MTPTCRRVCGRVPAVVRVPLIVARRPRKDGLKRPKQVVERQRDDHVVVYTHQSVEHDVSDADPCNGEHAAYRWRHWTVPNRMYICGTLDIGLGPTMKPQSIGLKG